MAQIYESVREFEPRAQYSWDCTTTWSGTPVNVLIGRNPNRGSSRTDKTTFRSRDDLVLTEGVRAVARTLGASRLCDPENPSTFFQVQMAYMLLWSVVERFSALRYGPFREPDDKIRRLGKSHEWAKALHDADLLSEGSSVVDSRNPRDVYRLDRRKPLRSLQYFYQFRCNLVHRGKGMISDVARLETGGLDLMSCLQSVWKANSLPWFGSP